MTHQTITADRKRDRHRDWEDWKWYEDPYAGTGRDNIQTAGAIAADPETAPAPLPPFAPEIPIS
jgi:hypothetical protein